jgi:hypothetical protein
MGEFQNNFMVVGEDSIFLGCKLNLTSSNWSWNNVKCPF